LQAHAPRPGQDREAASVVSPQGTVRLALLLASAVLALSSAPALAQTAASPAAPQAPDPGPICTDRPTKASADCTVPQGDLQLEASVVAWGAAPVAGATTDTTLFPNPTLKYGVSADLDVEVNWAPWEQVRTIFDGHGRTDASDSDLVLRAKWAPIGGDVFAAALIPYVRLPTASHEVGDGHVEGGLILPLVITLPAELKLTLQPELDAMENAPRTRTDLGMANLIDLSRALGPWTLYAEIWNDQAFGPMGTTAQTTADLAVSWRATKIDQLDAGANLGLDRLAPRQQYYVGYSRRF
jgi:hypothetical protein